MLFSVEQAFVGRDEERAPLKTPAREAMPACARTSCKDFATGKNVSFNQCHNKELCAFSRESKFIKAMENFSPVFA